MTLEIRGLTAGYGGSTVLEGLDMRVESGEVTALLGRNGAGKTTLVQSIMGMVRSTTGSVHVNDTDISGRPTHSIARAGVSLVPQGRRVFGSLTVAEHLALADNRSADSRWTVQRVLDLWPQLGGRLRHRASQLSGGEQQMLAIARALLAGPRVLLLDEPSEGLAHSLLREFGSLLGSLADDGVAVLLVEQNIPFALGTASRVAVLAKGRIVDERGAAEVRATPGPVHELLSA